MPIGRAPHRPEATRDVAFGFRRALSLARGPRCAAEGENGRGHDTEIRVGLTGAGNLFSIALHHEERTNMKIAKGLLLLLAIWIGLAAAFSGCTCVVNNYHYGTARPSAMYVANAPPAPKEEVRTAAPPGDFVWIAGHWEWSASEETWIWVGGTWVEPPDDGATWVDPEYEDNNGDWMYSPGYWRWENPGEAATDDVATPELPAGDLHWVGGHEVESPDGGAPSKPEEPKSPPRVIHLGVAKPDLPTVAPYQLATPKGDEPPHVTAPDLEAEDPYGSDVGEGSSGDDDDSKKVKKPKVKDVKPKKPEMPDVVEQHAAGVQKPEAKTDKKHHHKAKAELKADEGVQASKGEHTGKADLKMKDPDKIKKHH
jgi:hypothetical protein